VARAEEQTQRPDGDAPATQRDVHAINERLDRIEAVLQKQS